MNTPSGHAGKGRGVMGNGQGNALLPKLLQVDIDRFERQVLNLILAVAGPSEAGQVRHMSYAESAYGSPGVMTTMGGGLFVSVRPY